MKITEQLLLDNFDGITNGLYNVSVVDGTRIFWVYREGEDWEGFNVTVEKRSDASEITLEGDRTGKVELDDACADHPALDRMRRLLEKAIGAEI